MRVDPLPLSRDSAGVIRIAGTRVSLDSLMALYDAGASIQDLAEAFPDLTLADIHASIAYVLRHREEIDRYLEERRREATRVKVRIRWDFPEM